MTPNVGLCLLHARMFRYTHIDTERDTQAIHTHTGERVEEKEGGREIETETKAERE